jgi:hypothetical protein
MAQSVATAQVVAQAFAPQMNGVHARTAPGTQTPAPSHFAVARSLPVVHIGAVQVVPARYLRHAPAPSQVPSRPQVSAPLSAHWPSGSCPAGIVEHVPAVPARAHELQIPLHSVLQHAPSSQNPELHSSGAVHAPPSGFLPQLALMHVFGAVHSASFEQTVWQTAFAPHTKGAQLCVAGVGHAPLASQRDASVMVEPVHDASAQIAPCAYLRHAPAPSHTPSRPHVATVSSGHWSRGSVPTSAGMHVPRLPTAAQVMHVPAQSEVQHTPSTQNPLSQSVAIVHWAPSTNPTGAFSVEESTVPVGASGEAPSTAGPPPAPPPPPSLLLLRASGCAQAIAASDRIPTTRANPAK